MVLKYFEEEMRTAPRIHVLMTLPYVRTELQLRFAWCMMGLTRGEYDSEERRRSKKRESFPYDEPEGSDNPRGSSSSVREAERRSMFHSIHDRADFSTSIENNERDNFIRNRTVNSLEEKINKNMSSNAETLETQIAHIVEKKINEAMRKTHDKVDESYANVVKKVESYKNVNSPQNSKNNNNTTTHSIEHNVRVQGIHENPNKPRDVNLVQTYKKIEEILGTRGVKPKIVHFKRLGTFNKERKKPRTLKSLEH